MKVDVHIIKNKNMYTNEDLDIMFSNIPPHYDQNNIADDTLIKKFKTMQITSTGVVGEIQQRLDDVCPICLEDITEIDSTLDYCKHGCGKSVHVQCYNIWCNSRNETRKCVFCRHAWINEIEIENKYISLK